MVLLALQAELGSLLFLSLLGPCPSKKLFIMTNGRLLWVDDEIELLRGHIVFLEKKGYDVQTCVSGADAIETCRQNKFDLILLDENMPFSLCMSAIIRMDSAILSLSLEMG